MGYARVVLPLTRRFATTAHSSTPLLRGIQSKTTKLITSRHIMAQTTDYAKNFPSTLTDPPVKSIVPPGECQFGDEFISVPLLAKFSVSPTTYVLRFGLPDESKALGLSTCACILAGIKVDGEDEMTIRPYTPISTNAMIGSFDLLIKAYPDGKLSKSITSLTPSADETPVSFKHIKFNVKVQHPYGNPKFIGMIAGGTGISPMLQALHSILGEDKTTEESTKVSLLYGSQTSDDILGKEMLDVWSDSHKDNLSVTHILSNEPTDSSTADAGMERGYITKETIEKAFPSASNDVKIFVCGPPVMYDIFCGPRGEKEITGILGEMGYNDTQVIKF